MATPTRQKAGANNAPELNVVVSPAVHAKNGKKEIIGKMIGATCNKNKKHNILHGTHGSLLTEQI